MSALVTNYWQSGDNSMAPAFQRAIAAMAAQSGGDVIVPNSITPLPWTSGVNLNGLGGVTIKGEGRGFFSPAIEWSGPAGQTMLEMKGSRFCGVENLRLSAGNLAGIGIKHWWDGIGQASYSCAFKNLFIQNATVANLIVGDGNNLQTSEVDLDTVHLYDAPVNLKLIGQNTNCIRTKNLKLKGATYSWWIDGADVLAENTLWLGNGTDLYLSANQRPCIFLKGDTEGSNKFLTIPGFSLNSSIQFVGLDLNADKSNNKAYFAQDASLENVTWEHCGFKWGARVRLEGFYNGQTLTKGFKRFKNCRATDTAGQNTAMAGVLGYPTPLANYNLKIQIDAETVLQ